VSIRDDPDRDELEAAMAEAVANAAVEDSRIEADEQALIRLDQTGAIDQDEFLRRARALAERKAAERAPDGARDEVGDVVD
jgi:hypothetical protein